MIETNRGDELGEPYRRRIAEVLVRGFAEDFAYFSKDPRVLADAFAHMILLDRFYVARVDGEPAAALGMYAKLGFSEFHRRPARFAQRAGFSAYVSMNLLQD